MDKYRVLLSPRAVRDIDTIYEYIATELVEPFVAQQLVDEIEAAVLSLDSMPGRGAARKTGFYANKGYRQLFVKNYTIVYRIDERAKEVVVITVQYSRKSF